MFAYKIYKVGASGHVALREDLSSQTESAALRWAESAAIECTIELWRGQCLLARITPPR